MVDAVHALIGLSQGGSQDEGNGSENGGRRSSNAGRRPASGRRGLDLEGSTTYTIPGHVIAADERVESPTIPPLDTILADSANLDEDDEDENDEAGHEAQQQQAEEEEEENDGDGTPELIPRHIIPPSAQRAPPPQPPPATNILLEEPAYDQLPPLMATPSSLGFLVPTPAFNISQPSESSDDRSSTPQPASTTTALALRALPSASSSLSSSQQGAKASLGPPAHLPPTLSHTSTSASEYFNFSGYAADAAAEMEAAGATGGAGGDGEA